MTAVRGTISIVIVVVIVVTVLFVHVCAEEDGSTIDEAAAAVGSRSLRKEIGEDQWKAVEGIEMDRAGWIPDYNMPQQDQSLPKRRRLRKRKRRPPIISLTEDTNINIAEDRYPVRRVKRPQHLHEGQDLWRQMEKDGQIKSTKRRRIGALYHENLPEIQTDDNISVFQADEAIPEVKASPEAVPDLRAILKLAGGLSLSEILQQRNLSLTDLLKGEKEAILAITEKPDNQVITEYKNPVEEDLPKKTKYSSNYRSVSTRRSSTPSTHRVSIKPNNVIVVDFKPSLIGLDIVTKQVDPPEIITTTSTAKTSLDVKSKLKLPLPMTSAKLNKIFRSTAKTAVENEIYPTTLPSKAYKINIDDLFGLPSIKQETNEQTEEGPIRMSLDLNSFLEKKIENSIGSPVEATTLGDVFPEKLKTITAKDEISEVLQDEQSKIYLKKILELRNMTFEDLVDLRERGSSQRHLADLFHNNTKEPEPDDEPLIGAIKPEIPIKKNYPAIINPAKNEILPNKFQFDRQAKSHFLPLESTDSDGDSYVASVEPIEESNESKSIEESNDKGKYTVTSFPTYKIELDRKFQEKSTTPDMWKDNYPDIFDDFYKRTHQKGIVEDLSEKYFDELRTIDEVENTIAEKGIEKLNVEARKEIYADNDDDSIFIRLPYGVKHAIFASLLIIGISLVIFLTILMIFKWSQKHKKRLCYNGSFSCSKIKSPILEENSDRRSFRTFMSETLGRKKHYYKQHLQSVSDTIWENDKKSFQ